MANKKINELATRTPSLTDLLLVGDPSSGYSYKATITAVSNVIETSIANTFVTLGTTQTISGAKTFSNTITATSVANAPSSTGKFLVLNASNVINYRTSAEVLSDIGAQGSITLTTTGSSGAATLVGNTLNIPNYGSALSGYVPTSRTLTINGTAYDLSADRTWSVGTVTSVAMTVPTGLTVSGTPITTSGTLAVSLQSGYSIPTTASQTNWDAAYNDKINSAAVTGTTTKTLTLTQQDGGTVTASWSDLDSGSITGSGTTNYIPKFTSSSAIGNSVIYESSSNIGIGTTSPGAYSGYTTLALNNATNGGVLDFMTNGTVVGQFFNDNSNVFINGQAANANLIFRTNAGAGITERMRIDASGRLGLGVTPSAWGSGYKAFDFNTLGTLAASGSAVLLQNNSYNNGTNNIRKAIGEASSYSQSGGVHIWETAAFGSSGSTITFSEVMRIAASGNVGIGVSNPDSYNANAYKLVVGGTSTSGITIAGDLEGSGNLYFADGTTGDQAYRGYVTYNHSSDAMTFGTAATTRMTLSNTGNLGLGVTPSAWQTFTGLQVGSLASVASYSFGAGNAQTFFANNTYYDNSGFKYIATNPAAMMRMVNNSFQWELAPSGTAGNAISFTQAMTLDASGLLGVGTTSPEAKIHSYGTASRNMFGVSTVSLPTSGDEEGVAVIKTNSSLWQMSLVGYAASSKGLRIYNNGGTGYTSFEVAQAAGTRFIVNGDGNVGIGTTAPNYLLSVGTPGTTTDSYIQIGSTTTGSGNLFFGDATGTGSASFAGYLQYLHSSDAMIFGTASSERMRITSAGNVGIGTTSPAAKLDVGYVAGAVALRVSRGSSDILDFYQGGGVSYIDASASGGQIAFATVGSERMRITSGGNVGIGTTSPGAPLDVVGSARISGDYIATTSGNTGRFGYNAYYTSTGFNLVSEGAINLTFGTNSTERMRITSGGDLIVGGTTSYGKITAQSSASVQGNLNSNATASSGTRYHAVFYESGTERGSITSNGSSTSFNTLSDYRLKQDLKDFNGLNLINSIKIYDYQWKADSTRNYGAIAHELKSVIPYVVTGNKDGERMQQVDYSKLVPVLIKAIQEQQAQIEQLKTAIETLKNK